MTAEQFRAIAASMREYARNHPEFRECAERIISHSEDVAQRLDQNWVEVSILDDDSMDQPDLVGLSEPASVDDDIPRSGRTEIDLFRASICRVMTSNADPYPVLDMLMSGLVHAIAARVPLICQDTIAAKVCDVLRQRMVAWCLLDST
jgi:ketopantoate reductase